MTTPTPSPIDTAEECEFEIFEHTVFINLAERTDRLEHVTAELRKIGISNPERFNAVRTHHGAVGCSLSHIKCLETAMHRGYPYIFICEDDITFTNVDVFKKSLRKFCRSNYFKEFDMLMIGGNNAPPFQKTNDYCVRVSNCRTTTGYVVKQRYYSVLLQNFKEGVKHLIREPENKQQYAIDMYWRPLQTNDRWFLLIPLTVVQRSSYSDVEEREVDYGHLMLDLEKPWLTQQVPRIHNMSYVLK